MIPKESEAIIQRLVQTEQSVKTKRASVKKQENIFILSIFGTVALVAIAGTIAIVVSQQS